MIRASAIVKRQFILLLLEFLFSLIHYRETGHFNFSHVEPTTVFKRVMKEGVASIMGQVIKSESFYSVQTNSAFSLAEMHHFYTLPVFEGIFLDLAPCFRPTPQT